LKISLDYDLTYSLDPAFWNLVIEFSKLFGHEVRIVTVRDERYDRTAPLIEAEKIVPVIYTRGVAKKWFMSHFGDGFMPDVWIDDKPESVMHNSTFSPEGLKDWRDTRGEAA